MSYHNGRYKIYLYRLGINWGRQYNTKGGSKMAEITVKRLDTQATLLAPQQYEIVQYKTVKDITGKDVQVPDKVNRLSLKMVEQNLEHAEAQIKAYKALVVKIKAA